MFQRFKGGNLKILLKFGGRKMTFSKFTGGGVPSPMNVYIKYFILMIRNVVESTVGTKRASRRDSLRVSKFKY